jgi:hypothetical protein
MLIPFLTDMAVLNACQEKYSVYLMRQPQSNKERKILPCSSPHSSFRLLANEQNKIQNPDQELSAGSL